MLRCGLARTIGRRGLIAGFALAAVAAAVVLARPWADSVMTVRVSATTDGAPARVVFRTRQLFSEAAESLPVLSADVDLGAWSGKLVRLDVEGRVGRRILREGSSGYLACEGELVTPEGTVPIEFASWQQGHEIGLHTRPLGPLAFRLGQDGASLFAFAMKGSLWHVLKVPASAHLRLRLKPVLAASLSGRPPPYVPAVPQEPPPVQVPAERPERPPDIFIYVIDALRADRLGCYGYTRGTSPAIDAFAADASLYENAYTATTWTRPSVATMLTGLYASVHGAMHWEDGLADWPVLLPEMLQEAGYRTYCFVTNPNLSVPFGLDQGYDEFIFCAATAGWINEMVGRTLATQGREVPVFMYFQPVEPHNPYTPRLDTFKRFDRGFRGRCDGRHGRHDCMGDLDVLHPNLSKADVEHLRDLYDAEVYEADEGFAGFVRALRKAGRYENAVVVLTADHGEAFGEHDTVNHAWCLNQETMHIPLIIRFPRAQYAGVRAKERASLADVVPTMLAQVGLRPDLPYRLPGRDLAREALAPESGPTRRIYAEVSRWDTNDVDLVGVIDEDGYKRVIDVSVPPRETAAKKSLGLWDTRADPKEVVDLSGKLPVRAAYDEQLIVGWLLEQRYWRGSSPAPRPPRVDYDEAMKRQLRALGYVGGPAGKPDRTPTR